LDLFRDTIARSEIGAHAWWVFEAASHSEIYLHSSPILINKFRTHHFDDARTWRQATNLVSVPTRHPWTVGYLKQLDYYRSKGLLSYKDIRLSIISEPERGVVPLLDDIRRNIFVQMGLAARYDSERFGAADIDLIKRMFYNTYPLNFEIIQSACVVLDARLVDPTERLLNFKKAHHLLGWERDVSPALLKYFRFSTMGYYVLEHRLGYVAALDKVSFEEAYRDIDPYDIAPYVIYAETETKIRQKIAKIVSNSRNAATLNSHNRYYNVYLASEPEFMLYFPQIQLWFLSQPDGIKRPLVWVYSRALSLRRFFRRLAIKLYGR
jgi:hypothetical protein